MKKFSLLQVLILVLILMVSCGGEKAADNAADKDRTAEPVAQNPGTAGAAVDNEYFNLTLAEGWKAGPLASGMVNILPAGGRYTPGLYFKFEGKGRAVGTAEASIQSMIDQYKGSPMAETVIAGVPFKATTYVYGGSSQTIHVAFRSGTKVTITIEGKEAKENSDIQAMLQSLVLK